MKTFPIQCQDGAAPHPLSIPWGLAELAYSVYAARYGRQQSLEQLAKRGGFGPLEMDDYLPDWRERCRAVQLACYDCGRAYGDEFGFPDLVMPYEVWKQISPTGDEGGLLCPSCICRRLHAANIRTVGRFRSGPLAEE